MKNLLYICFVFFILASCRKLDNHDQPIGDPVPIQYVFTAERCNIEPYQYSTEINGFVFGEPQVVDSIWIHNETFYVQSDFRRGGVRIQLNSDSLDWRLQIFENGIPVWDTSGVSYQIKQSPSAKFKIMKDW